MTTDASKRQDLIDGLRALADWYEQHPDVPLVKYPEFRHCVNAGDDATGRAEVHAIADALGVPVTDKDDESEVIGDFAGLPFRAYYVTRERLQRWRDDMDFLATTRSERGA